MTGQALSRCGRGSLPWWPGSIHFFFIKSSSSPGLIIKNLINLVRFVKISKGVLILPSRVLSILKARMQNTKLRGRSTLPFPGNLTLVVYPFIYGLNPKSNR